MCSQFSEIVIHDKRYTTVNPYQECMKCVVYVY